MTTEIPATLQQLAVPVTGLKPYGKNPRRGNVEMIKDSLSRHGQYKPIVVRTGTNEVLAGNHTLKAAKELGWSEIAATFVDVDDDKAARIVLIDNRSNDVAGYDDEVLQELLQSLPDLDGTGFDPADLSELTSGAEDAAATSTLVERFGMAPFTVLDSRSGAWQARKNSWKALGIQSELGRSDDLLWDSPQTRFANWYEIKNKAEQAAGGKTLTGKEIIESHRDELIEFSDSGTSIFDPVLAELSYRWFCPPQGHVLDPWAGGSVRGLVAARLGRSYTGVELREEQVDANRDQAHLANGPLPAVLAAAPGTADRPIPATPDFTPDLTPVELHAGIYVKREDAWSRGGASGAKSRTMFKVAEGAPGLITAGARNSAQIERGALVAKALGIPAHIHTGAGKDTAETTTARRAGADVYAHKPGRLSVIKARFNTDMEENPTWASFPFGMGLEAYPADVAAQTENIPDDVKRVVVPFGSGATLAGVVRGLRERGRQDLPVVAISVGTASTDYLDKFAPGWRQQVTIIEHPTEYDTPATNLRLGALTLDPIYEAKCIDYLQAGDLLWTVGIRASAQEQAAGTVEPENPTPYWIVGESSEQLAQLPAEQYDMLIGCPPYYDLEVYSDDPRDMSNMAPADFDKAMIENVKRAAACLRPDSYAVFVVGAVRNKHGQLMDMRSLMIRAAGEAGLAFHNDMILLTATGTVAIRAARGFIATRVLGRTHQDVLVFVKGDRKAAAQRCSDIELEASLEALNNVEVTDDGSDS